MYTVSDRRIMSIKIGSFFSGAGGLDTGFHNAGFDVIWANEFDKRITPTLRANFPTTTVVDKSLFDVASDEVPDGLTGIVGGPPCFTTGNFVLTANGYKDISDIRPGDSVMTHTGEYREVFDYGTAQAEILNVKIFGTPSIATTAGHPFYVVERSEEKKEKWNDKTTYIFSKPHWVVASKLTKNHFVISPLDSIREESHHRLTPEEAYFIGHWVGDGWLRKTSRIGTYNKTLKDGTKTYRKSGFKKTIHICGSFSEQDILTQIFNNMFNTFHVSEMRTVLRFSGYSSRLFEILEEFGAGASEKSFPNWVFSEPLHIQQKMLEGYMDSDGNASDNTKNLTTVSYKLALGTQRLVRNIYRINPHITKFIRPKQTVIEGRTVQQKDTYQIRWYIAGNKSTTFFEDGFMFSKVYEVEETNHTEQVFNFSVREDESYTINNFAVHNCQSWSLGGKGLGLGDKRGEVFLEYIRVIRDKQPLFFLAENVKGMLAKTRAKDLQVILDAFDELGYNLSYQLVNANDYGVPQDRWRVFFVGYRKDLGKTFSFPQPDGTHLNLRDAIGDLNGSATPALALDKPNKSLAVSNHEYGTGTFSSQYMSRNRVRLWDQPSFTIQASGRQAPLHPSSGLMVKEATDLFRFKNETYRRLTIREAARIQTFPDSYEFIYPKLEIGYKMVGNAVPVKLAEVIATQIRSDLSL